MKTNDTREQYGVCADNNQNKTVRRERLHWLDICKGIAIILVVVGHVGSVYQNTAGLSDAYLFHFIHDYIYTFHMPLFLIISGYLHKRSFQRENIGAQIRKKLIAYGLPYIFFSLLYWLLKMIGSGHVNHEAGIADLLLIPLVPMSFMWYLYAVMIMSIMTALMQRKNDNNRIVMTAAITGRLIWIVLSRTELFRDGIISDSIVFDCLKNYIWFAAGAVYGQRCIEYSNTISLRQKYLTAFAGTVLPAPAVIAGIHTLPGLMLVCGIAGSVGMIALSMIVERSQLLEYLGSRTLPIYLLHGTVLSVVKIIFTRLNFPLLNGFGPMIYCTAAGLLIPLIVCMAAERIRLMDALFYPAKYI